MSKLAEEFQKALDYVNAAENNNHKYNRWFCYSEEQKDIINQYIPDADVVILPQFMNDNDDNNKVYIIPMENIKPIKFVIEE